MAFAACESAPFGTFNGITYVRRTGCFEGETSLGAADPAPWAAFELTGGVE